MVDIQSATAEIRRGKKKKEEETGQKYNVRICYAGHLSEPATAALQKHLCETVLIQSL